MTIECITHFFSVTKDIVLTAAAVIGAYVAIKGLSTWNRQLKGGVEYDLSRRILKCTYRLRESIKGVRNPLMWAYEMPKPPESEAEDMTPEQVRHYGLSNAYQKRWDKVTDIRTDLQTEMLEGEAIWGRVVYEKFDSMFDLQQELFSSVHLYLAICNPETSEQTRVTYEEMMRNKRDILYDLSTESPDEFTEDINRAVEGIESFLKPHLRK